MKIALLTTDNRENSKSYSIPAPYFGTAPQALLDGFALLPETEIHVVSCTQVPMSSPEKLAPNIFFHSLYVRKLGWLRSGYQGCIRAVRRKLKEIKPELVHGQGTERDCAISAVFSGFPSVLTIHGNMRSMARIFKPKPFSYGWLAARLEAFTIPRSDGVVCITRYTQQEVSRLARTTWVVPNAVDPSFFEIDASPGSEEPARILCVGQICPRKNQVELIHALDPLIKKHQFQVAFFGQGEEGHPYVTEFYRLLKTRPWCLHEGFADRARLKRELRQATLLTLPSLEDNCPMAVLEAMAAGVPVVVAKVGGLPDLVEDGKTGIFCDPHDPVSIGGAIVKALVLSMAQNLAREAKLRARERFHPRVVAEKHLEIYREVLNHPHKSSRLFL